MFNHIMVGSNDIERSKRFYDAVLGTLGAGEALRNTATSGHLRLFYRHDGSTFCVSQPINGKRRRLRMEEPSRSSARRLNRYERSMTRPSLMGRSRSRIRPECATAP